LGPGVEQKVFDLGDSGVYHIEPTLLTAGYGEE
jgi:hypothetical protein